MRFVIFSFVILTILLSLQGIAQVTKIMGKVTDKSTGETLPFASVQLKGTKIGTITDINGNFKLESSFKSDSIIVSCVGYRRYAAKITRGKFQTIDVALESTSLEIGEVVVSMKKRSRTKDELALLILDSIQANRDDNNIDKLASYEFETYNKIQFDINNITDEFRNRKVLKPFQFIFDYVDTSTVNGKAYLPVFLVESMTDYYYRKNPKAEREVIKASRASGIENESINQFMGNMYVKINIYDPYIDLFGKGFVSPVNSIGRLYYKYFIVDSTTIDNNWCYHMVFLPRNEQDFAFNGDFWVADTSWAIKKIELRIDKNVNLNFVNSMIVTQEFIFVDSTVWMMDKEMVVIDFNVFEDPKQALGFFGRKTTTFKGHSINKTRDDAFYAATTNIIVDEDASNKDEAYWTQARHEDLTQKEKQIYQMVDTIKSLPAFKTYYEIISTFVTYYYVWGYVELGPYFTTYSFNQVEGNRFRFGGRTSNKFSTKLMVEAYAAYGTKDERFKYGGNFLYLLSKNPRRGFGAEYKYDMEQLGQSVNAFREDNILSSVLRRSPNVKLSMVEESNVFYEHEWFQGFSNRVSLVHREMYPVFDNTFNLHYGNETRSLNTLVTTAITLNTRFAYNEKFVMGEFERISLGTNYPVLNVYYTFGPEEIWNSGFTFHRAELTVDHWFNLYPIGYSKYILEAGQIWGRLPYPLLKMHEGNETYGFDPYSFNLMNYYEFVSDRWVSLYYTHHFEGFFLNKFPLLKKLKWREVVWGKGVIGALDNGNVTIMEMPGSLGSFSPADNVKDLKPYVECGAGIENIFRLLRFDVVWRLSYLDHPDIAKWGFRLSLQLKF